MTTQNNIVTSETWTPRGLIARPTIQCIDPRDNKIGCWLFTGESHKATNSAVSPRFDDLVDLFKWCLSNGWKQYAGAYVYEP